MQLVKLDSECYDVSIAPKSIQYAIYICCASWYMLLGPRKRNVRITISWR